MIFLVHVNTCLFDFHSWARNGAAERRTRTQRGRQVTGQLMEAASCKTVALSPVGTGTGFAGLTDRQILWWLKSGEGLMKAQPLAARV